MSCSCYSLFVFFDWWHSLFAQFTIIFGFIHFRLAIVKECLIIFSFVSRNEKHKGTKAVVIQLCVLFYQWQNDRALLVLKHTVTHDFREVLCQLHMLRGTLKPHPVSVTLIKAPNGPWGCIWIQKGNTRHKKCGWTSLSRNSQPTFQKVLCS